MTTKLFTAATAVLALYLLSPYRPTVKSLLLRLLSLYKMYQQCRLRLSGTTAEEEAVQRLVSGQTWEEFCDTIKAAGTAIISTGTPKDAASQVEGYRYLTRLLRVSLEAFVECNDPEHPVIVALSNGSRAARVCIGSDNPDNLYQSASIHSRNNYVVRGDRGSVHYLGFGTQSGSYGTPGGLSTVDYKDISAMDVQEDGTIEFYLSVDKPKDPRKHKNWLRLDKSVGPHVLIIRNTFMNRSQERESTLRIEKVEGTLLTTTTNKVKVAGSMTAEEFESGLNVAGMFVAATPMLFVRWANGFQQHVNQLPLFDQETSNKMGGDPNIRYYHSAWCLQHHQALVIDAVPPACDTWNLQMNNYWMESLDYRYHTIHTNKGLATYVDSAKQKVRIIVAHQDPHVPGTTWLRTAGHTHGTMCFRWIKPRKENGELYEAGDVDLPSPVPRVVEMDNLLALKFAL